MKHKCGFPTNSFPSNSLFYYLAKFLFETIYLKIFSIFIIISIYKPQIVSSLFIYVFYNMGNSDREKDFKPFFKSLKKVMLLLTTFLDFRN